MSRPTTSICQMLLLQNPSVASCKLSLLFQIYGYIKAFIEMKCQAAQIEGRPLLFENRNCGHLSHTYETAADKVVSYAVWLMNNI